MMLVRSPMNHCQLYMFLPEGLAEVVAIGHWGNRSCQVERHVIDDPSPPFRAPLGLQPLMDAQLEGLDRGLDVGRPGDGRERPAEDQMAGVVLGGKMPPALIGQGEVAADVFVGVVVEVVLHAERFRLTLEKASR